MFYSKEDLAGRDYDWGESSRDSSFTGSPTRRTFDRFNGQQLLFIINFFCESVGRRTIADARKIEELIYSRLPMDVKSELSVIRWLSDTSGHED